MNGKGEYPSARYWYEHRPVESLHLAIGENPRANSIAVWQGDSSNKYGHVAYVEKVEGDTIIFTEANVETNNKGGGYDGYVKEFNISTFKNRENGFGPLLGYIYLENEEQIAATNIEQGQVTTTPEPNQQISSHNAPKSLDEAVQKSINTLFKGIFKK